MQLHLRAAVLGLVAAGFVLSPSLAAALELVEVVKQVEKSVVRVDTDAGLGSGVVVDDRGWVLTNFHVIDGARRATITLRSGKVLRALGYLAIDPLRDLALLQTEEIGQPAAIQIARALPAIGEKVAAFGNPKGFSFTTSEGIVSAVRSGKEVETIIGAAEYAGLATDATWVQTTAPISPGNSGGPLVNMNAELVGINSWTFTGQNLNFAVGLPDITRLLGRKLDAGPQDFATLPKVQGRQVAPEDWWEEFRLALPTGRVFSFEIFDITSSNVNRASQQQTDADCVIFKHANGALYAAASHERGVLHGPTIARYENKEPMVYVNYQEGKRHGLLKTWDEEGEPRVFAQYVKGRRYGLSCFFEHGVLAMIAQHKNDEVEYLQLMSGLSPIKGFTSEAEARRDPKASGILEQWDKLEGLLKKNEATFRKQVRRAEIERRRELAKQLGPIKRDRIADRRRVRDAQNAAFFRELERIARGR